MGPAGFARRSALAFVLSLLPAPTVAWAGGTGAPETGSSTRTAMEERAAAEGLRASVLRLAIQAHTRAISAGLTSSPILTVIDYSLRSRERRLWVLDLRAGRVLAGELVAHGRGSGGDQAERFSNRPGSLQSSLGTFLTGATYRGKHGTSLRLKGLDRGLNDRAEARAIVIHGADYVNQEVVRQLGRLGRSQGCPALSRTAAPRIIELIRGGTVLFSYHPSAALGRAVASR